ncbi:MAG: AbrB/MazE/SpoVT family DNA-binding domain-containing protein [Thermomicrobiales bacterium]
MSAHLGVITRKGQITVPADIRRALQLQEGDTVAFRIEDGEVRVRPAKATLADGYQSIPALTVPKTDAEIAAIVRDERATRYKEELG